MGHNPVELRIPEHFEVRGTIDLDDLLEAIDIAEYIGQYADLREKDGELWGLSPFTDEQTPSFSVHPDKNVFHDFSSGIGGTVIRFAMTYHHFSFRQAVAHLAAYAGLSDTDEVSNRLEAVKVAKQYKNRRPLPKQKKSKRLPANYMDRFEPGGDKLTPWLKEGISPEVLALFQVRYDAFFDRLVFPVRDMEGHIINVIGRTLDPDYKENGFSKYQPYFPFGYLDTLAGYWENRTDIHEQKEIILFEGVKSVMLARTWCVCNTAAIMTSHLSPTCSAC